MLSMSIPAFSRHMHDWALRAEPYMINDGMITHRVTSVHTVRE